MGLGVEVVAASVTRRRANKDVCKACNRRSNKATRCSPPPPASEEEEEEEEAEEEDDNDAGAGGALCNSMAALSCSLARFS